jgi:hypothetical protein
MERGRFYQQFEKSGSGEAGNAAHSFNAFVDRLAPTGERAQQHQETGLQRVHPFDPYNLMRKFNDSYERKQWNELGFQPTDEQNTLVRNVRFAYGIIAEPFCAETTASGEQSRTYYQDTIVHEIGFDQRANGNNKVILNDEERGILVKIAKAVGIPCDPERKVYFYNEIPPATWLDRKKRIFPTPNVVDTEK